GRFQSSRSRQGYRRAWSETGGKRDREFTVQSSELWTPNQLLPRISSFMCGIVGIVESDLERPVDRSVLQTMVRTLVHRGPDEEGSIALNGVGLAMRRLAIVDLAGGQQPFTNATGDIQLVANGEIYNFPELRREL